MMEPPFGHEKPFLFFTHLFLPVILQKIIGWILVATCIIIYYIKNDFENKVEFM